MCRMMHLLTLVIFVLSVAEGARWKNPRANVKKIPPGANKKNHSFKRALGLLRKDDDVVLKDEADTKRKTKLTRLQQTFKKLPVYGALTTIETDLITGKYTKRAKGRMVSEISKDLRSTKPRFSKDRALEIAKANSDFNLELTQFRNEQVELLIMIDNNVAKLAYRVSFFGYSSDLIGRPDFFIDAKTGEVIKMWHRLEMYDHKGIGGNFITGKYYYGTDRPALNLESTGNTCVMENQHVRVFNLHRNYIPYDRYNPYNFSCSYQPSDYVNGAYSPVNDLFNHATKTFEMYRDWIGVPPTKKLPMDLWCHYGINDVNAYFDGTQFVFGDGDGRRYHPLVVQDIVTHEISHAFVEKFSNLEYNGQAGAINEAFCDLAGEAAEVYVTKKKSDMIAGREASTDGTGWRNLCDQKVDGKSITHMSQYVSGMKVHYASGVFNKAMCILKDSPTWSIPRVFAAFAYANRFFWYPSSNFSDAACGVMWAAYMYGFDLNAVRNAFSQVGITTCDVLSQL